MAGMYTPFAASSLLILSAFLAPLPSTAQGQELPVDSATVRQLLGEATLALRRSGPELRFDGRLAGQLAGLRESWGMGEMEPIPAGDDGYDTLRVLLEAEEIVLAADWLLSRDPTPRGQTFLLPVGHRLVRAREDERALAVAHHLGDGPRAIVWILSDVTDRPESRLGRVRELVDAGLVPDEDEPAVAAQLLATEAASDFDAAWTRTDTVSDPARRVSLRMGLLPLPTSEDPERRLELILEVYEDVLSLEDAGLRTRHLTRFAFMCDQGRLGDCEDLAELPFRPSREGTRHRRSLQNAILGEGFDEAGIHLDSLANHFPEDRVALSVLRALVRDVGIRLHGEQWHQWSDDWVARGLALAVAAEPGVADSLRASAAPLLARDDPPGAFTVAEKIHDRTLRAQAYGQMAELLRPVDLRAAWQAARRGRDDHRARGTAASLYPAFRTMGDTAAAREALEMADPWRAPRVLLEWAGRELRAGRWAAAREAALAARDLWEGVEEIFISRRETGLYLSLGLYPDMLEWARELEPPEARARALIHLVDGLTRAAFPPPVHKPRRAAHVSRVRPVT